MHFKIGVGRLSSSGVLSAFCKTLVGNSIIISVKGYGDIIEDKNTFWKSIEISASVFPLVSGTALAMKTKPVVQNTLFWPIWPDGVVFGGYRWFLCFSVFFLCFFVCLSVVFGGGYQERRLRSKSKSILGLREMSRAWRGRRRWWGRTSHRSSQPGQSWLMGMVGGGKNPLTGGTLNWWRGIQNWQVELPTGETWDPPKFWLIVILWVGTPVKTDCDWDVINRQSVGGASNLGRQNLSGGHPDQRAVPNVEHKDVHLVATWWWW